MGQGQWHTPVRKSDYLFPTRALSKVWRAKFMQHVLPSGLKRIRHYGLLANPTGAKLAQAKAALHMPVPNPKAQACAQDFMARVARVARVNIHQCPVCQQGRLGVVQTLARAKHLPDPFECSTRKANSRAARLRHSRAGKNVAVAAQQTGTVARKRPLQAPSQVIMTSHGGG
ncbi:MAG: transposase [Hydrogenophaga sp.]|uniref:transposase n=1 Tax=Hydrogenophaga sp. TaxID=1904254 RepID=UPI002722CDDE|nr:transposase [Hydrogenophaga sp.]MDO9570896.1 transposase [Hydrogenophaga sp.]